MKPDIAIRVCGFCFLTHKGDGSYKITAKEKCECDHPNCTHQSEDRISEAFA